MNRILMLLLLVSSLIGCSPETPATNTPPPPPARTAIPTFSFVQPTVPPQVSTAVTTLTIAPDTLDIQAVERGRDRYQALECAACHGDSGEGTDDGPSLAESTMSEQEFISFMRSGGELGAEHQYSTNRLSASGGANLYQYLLRLRP
jgi:mono/diheme cytochrome c family protein